jgi:hypothetical protein
MTTRDLEHRVYIAWAFGLFVLIPLLPVLGFGPYSGFLAFTVGALFTGFMDEFFPATRCIFGHRHGPFMFRL